MTRGLSQTSVSPLSVKTETRSSAEQVDADPAEESKSSSEAPGDKNQNGQLKNEAALEKAKEQKLVRRLQKGDPRAFRELVQTYQHRVYGLTFRMLGNPQEAEDVAQDVFLSVYRAIGRYRGDSKLYTWIYRIACNACKNRIKYLKGRKADRRSSFDTIVPSGTENDPNDSLQSTVPGPEASVEGSRLEQAIQRELAQLDSDQRMVIVLRDIQGLSYQDMIEITGINLGTIKSRLHRARLALKNRILPYLK